MKTTWIDWEEPEEALINPRAKAYHPPLQYYFSVTV
jgi:hypothetical protein